jgi:hypothetical protein
MERREDAPPPSPSPFAYLRFAPAENGEGCLLAGGASFPDGLSGLGGRSTVKPKIGWETANHFGGGVQTPSPPKEHSAGKLALAPFGEGCP